MGPEVLSGQLDKPADIFSLGLTILELATNVVLPDNGPEWQKLREGDISATNLDSVSGALVDLIRSMLHSDAARRPTIDVVLAHDMLAAAVQAKHKGGPTALEGLFEVPGVEDDNCEDNYEELVQEAEDEGIFSTPVM
ncbi:hypothetical protein BC938DRAFT_477795 [Jimgerdemannia flammicorona]|uniref:Protein kinase domain-containing protein n=1 Tax=Jimgerdemannia flammicorona TaxID=994334 RepID=A0A433QNT8_9FUNG|nr:hypothetical protein BC938DRAFT_477795 [Jimgerdemannia flammicorona]